MKSIKFLIVCTILFCVNLLTGQTITVTDNKGISLQMDIDDISYAVKNTVGQSVIIPVDKNVSYIYTSSLQSIQTLGCNKFYLFKVGKKNGSFALNDSVLTSIKFSQVQQTTTSKAVVKSIINGFSLITVELYTAIISQADFTCGSTGGGGGSGWGLTGNATTTPGTNFIGTTDAQDVVFKRNNVESGYMKGTNVNSYGQGNITRTNAGTINNAFGSGNMPNNVGSVNGVFGYNNLPASTNMTNTFAFGSQNGNVSTTGSFAFLFGQQNLFAATTINNSLVSGYRNGYSYISPNNLIGIGFQNFYLKTSGASPYAVGFNVFRNNRTGDYLSGNGINVFQYNATGNNNTGSGYNIYNNCLNCNENTGLGSNLNIPTTNTAVVTTPLSSFTLASATGGVTVSGAAIGTAITLSGKTTGQFAFIAEVSSVGSFIAEVTNSTTILLHDAVLATISPRNLTLKIPTDIDNTTAIGSNILLSKSNQVVLGGTNTQSVKFRGETGYNYEFNTASTIGSTDRDKAFLYESETSQFKLKGIPKDTIYVVASGQSNMAGYGYGGDTTINNDVLVWETNASRFAVATRANVHDSLQNFNILYLGRYITENNSLAWAFCKQLQKKTGRPVKLVLSARSGRPIADWTIGQPQWTYLSNAITQSGIPRADVVLWMQGEQDALAGTGDANVNYYIGKLDTLYRNLETLLNQKQLRFLAFKCSPSNYTNWNLTYDKAVNSKMFMESVSSEGMTTLEGVHYTGGSLDTLGWRGVNVYTGLPKTRDLKVNGKIYYNNEPTNSIENGTLLAVSKFDSSVYKVTEQFMTVDTTTGIVGKSNITNLSTTTNTGFRVKGALTGTMTGSGIDLLYSGTVGYIYGYNRTANNGTGITMSWGATNSYNVFGGLTANTAYKNTFSGSTLFQNNIAITGNLDLGTAGNKISIKEGSNASMGTATLVGGTVTVSNTLVTANSRIFVTVQTAGGTQGFLSVTRSAGTSFTITSTSALETSTVSWIIIEPTP